MFENRVKDCKGCPLRRRPLLPFHRENAPGLEGLGISYEMRSLRTPAKPDPLSPGERFALRDCVGNTLRMLVCQLHNHEAALVDGLELNTEEHGGDVRQDEGLVLLDENILGVGHLVVTD